MRTSSLFYALPIAALVSLAPALSAAQTTPPLVSVPVLVYMPQGKTMTSVRGTPPCPTGNTFFMTRFDASIVANPTDGNMPAPPVLSGRWSAELGVPYQYSAPTFSKSGAFRLIAFGDGTNASAVRALPAGTPWDGSVLIRFPGLTTYQFFAVLVSGYCAPTQGGMTNWSTYSS